MRGGVGGLVVAAEVVVGSGIDTGVGVFEWDEGAVVLVVRRRLGGVGLVEEGRVVERAWRWRV